VVSCAGGLEAERQNGGLEPLRKVCDFDVKNRQFSVIKAFFSSLSDVTDQWRGNVFGKEEGKKARRSGGRVPVLG